MLRFAISSWSVDGLLNAGLPLLDLPAELKKHNIGTLELCHFHLPSTEPDYLAALRARLEAAEIELFSVLIDAGDVAEPDSKVLEGELELIRRYVRAAAALGAERVRISAGQQPATPQTLAQSAAQLTDLMAYAAPYGVAVSTENWQLTAQHPEAVLGILGACPEGLGLCVDTGNAEAATASLGDKYDMLAQLLPHATSVHFKAHMTSGDLEPKIDSGDVRRCLELLREASFAGPISLIYDRKHNEWDGLKTLQNTLQDTLQNSSQNTPQNTLQTAPETHPA